MGEKTLSMSEMDMYAISPLRVTWYFGFSVFEGPGVLKMPADTLGEFRLTSALNIVFPSFSTFENNMLPFNFTKLLEPMHCRITQPKKNSSTFLNICHLDLWMYIGVFDSRIISCGLPVSSITRTTDK